MCVYLFSDVFSQLINQLSQNKGGSGHIHSSFASFKITMKSDARTFCAILLSGSCPEDEAQFSGA